MKEKRVKKYNEMKVEKRVQGNDQGLTARLPRKEYEGTIKASKSKKEY